MRRLLAFAALATLVGCGHEQDMPEHAAMPDSMPIVRAMRSPAVADSMLDTMPGGEMARGDSAAAMKLLKTKM